MNEKTERRSTIASLCITIPALASALLFIGYLAISHRLLQIERLQDLPTQIPVGTISDLMFSPAGRLIVIVESLPGVEIYSWDPKYRPMVPPKAIINFGSLIGRPQSEFALRSPLATGADQRIGSRASTTPTLPYAISDDGSMIAWSWNGQLFAGPFGQPKRFRVQLEPSTAVVALSFINPDLVAVIHSGGEVRLEKLSGGVSNFPGTQLHGDWRISGRGPFRLLSRFKAHQVVRFDSRSFQGLPASSRGSFLVASQKGRIAIGSTDGEIFFPQPFGPALSVQLPEIGKVQALVAYDENRLIVGQKGGGLYLVDRTRGSGEQAIPLIGYPVPDARFVAISEDRIAVVTSRSIAIGKLGVHLVLGERQKWWLGLTFSFLSVLAFLRLIVIDAYKLRSLPRNGSSASSPLDLPLEGMTQSAKKIAGDVPQNGSSRDSQHEEV